jgi:hypothetical protein
MPSTTPAPAGEQRTVRVVHPFHPWSGREFTFVTLMRTWKQDRVYFFGDDGTMQSLPTAWTDAAEPDVFVSLSAGRSAFRPEDLLVLAEVVDGLSQASGEQRSVK